MKIILPPTKEELEILKKMMNPQSLEDYGLGVSLPVVDERDIIESRG